MAKNNETAAEKRKRLAKGLASFGRFKKQPKSKTVKKSTSRRKKPSLLQAIRILLSK